MVEVGDNTKEVNQQGEENELIEANDLLALIPGNMLVEPRIHYIAINSPGQI